jgi:Flp pilus assembly pilin Flp
VPYLTLARNRVTNIVGRLVRDGRGQDLMEYALLGSFIALAAALGVTQLGTHIVVWYNVLAARILVLSSLVTG